MSGDLPALNDEWDTEGAVGAIVAEGAAWAVCPPRLRLQRSLQYLQNAVTKLKLRATSAATVISTCSVGISC